MTLFFSLNYLMIQFSKNINDTILRNLYVTVEKGYLKILESAHHWNSRNSTSSPTPQVVNTLLEILVSYNLLLFLKLWLTLTGNILSNKYEKCVPYVTSIEFCSSYLCVFELEICIYMLGFWLRAIKSISLRKIWDVRNTIGCQ